MDINDFDLGDFEIKGKYSYIELQSIAERKLMLSASRFIKSFIALCAVMVFLILLVAVVAKGASTVPILGKVLTNLVGTLSAFAFISAFVASIDIFRKIKRLKDVYQYDMRAIREKLENCNIFMDLPDSDYYKFDHIFNIFYFYIKNRKTFEENLTKK